MMLHQPLSFIGHRSFVLDDPNTSLNQLMLDRRLINHQHIFLLDSKQFTELANARTSLISIGD
jgi:hypothetical protein